MVKAAFFGIFRTEKKCSLLEAAFHFQIEVDLSQKDSKHRDEWFADGVWEKCLKSSKFSRYNNPFSGEF